MLTPITTPTIPRDLGIQGIENELSRRSSGTSPSLSLTTMIFNQSRSMPHLPTSPERHWPSQGPEGDFTPPPTASTTLSLLFSETTYPSLPREGTESRLSHTDSGPTSPTPVTAPTSPIRSDYDEETTPLALRLRNPFLASIIAH